MCICSRNLKHKFRRELNERVSASAVDWSGDEAAMSLIGSPTDGSFMVTHTPDGSKQLLCQQTVTALILMKIHVSALVCLDEVALFLA